MKSDKILFGLACLGMGLMLHSVIQKSDATMYDSKKVDTTVIDSLRQKYHPEKDSIILSEYLKKDSAKILKSVKR